MLEEYTDEKKQPLSPLEEIQKLEKRISSDYNRIDELITIYLNSFIGEWVKIKDIRYFQVNFILYDENILEIRSNKHLIISNTNNIVKYSNEPKIFSLDYINLEDIKIVDEEEVKEIIIKSLT